VRQHDVACVLVIAAQIAAAKYFSGLTTDTSMLMFVVIFRLHLDQLKEGWHVDVGVCCKF